MESSRDTHEQSAPPPDPALPARAAPSPSTHGSPSLPGPPLGDLPAAPEEQERFHKVHNALKAVGAHRVSTIAELQDDIDDTQWDDDDRRLEEEDAAALASSSAHSSDIPSDSAPRPRRRTSRARPSHDGDSSDDDRLAAKAPRKPDWAHLASAESVLASAAAGPADQDQDEDTVMAAPDGREDEDADLEENGDDEDDVDGVPLKLDSTTAAASPSAPSRTATSSADKRDAVEVAQVPGALDSDVDKVGEKSLARPFEQYWSERVSKLHPPHVWYHQSPLASSTSASTSPANNLLIGCTLTLTLPDSSSRTFTASPTYTTRKAARDAVFALAWAAKTHEEGRAQREQVGWDREVAEERDETERVRASVGGEKPWEALRAEGERWMAEPVRWEFEEDSLNTTHACRLTVPVSPTSTLTFLTPTTFTSHRSAKDAAARLALEAGVSAHYERAFKERLERESGGYLQFDATSGQGAVLKKQVEGAEGVETSDKESMDPVVLLQAEVKSAFGGVNKFVEWSFGTSSGNSSSGNPLLSCTFKLTFPEPEPVLDPTSFSSTSTLPASTEPFTCSVPASYHTKAHARTSCAALAFRLGVTELLRPFQAKRADELRARKADRERRERERREEREKGGIKSTPRAGRVPYEELDALDNPAAYLNICAQQWTGNSSPLKFEYATAESPGTRIKQHGCTVTVLVDRTFSRTYTIPPSSSTLTRAAAKDAAIRLALRQRVLDLLKPADVDPRSTTTKAAKRARKVDGADSASSSAEASSGAGGAVGKRARKAAQAVQVALGSPWAAVEGAGASARVPLPGESAVGFLDQVCLAQLGAGGLPQYDVFQDPSSGCFGAALRIALGPSSSSSTSISTSTSPSTVSYSSDAVHPSRTHAQEAAATVAVRDGLVERLKLGGAQPRPPATAQAAPAGLAVVGESPHMAETSASAAAAGAAATSADADEGINVAQAGGKGSLAPVAAALDVDAAVAVVGPQHKLEEEEERIVVEGYRGGSGAAVQQLRDGCAAVLGPEESGLPRYRVVQKGSLFSASVIVLLDTFSSATRAFGVPPSCTTRDDACDAAAQAALSAGALELVQARHRPPPPARSAHSPPQASSHAASASSKSRRGKQMSPARSGEEQAALRRAAYGGFGAATAATVASAVEEDKARARAQKDKEERAEVGRNPLIPHAATATAQVAQRSLLAPGERAAAVDPLRSASAVGAAHGLVMDGPSVSALKAYCLAKALPIPLLRHEPLADGASHKVHVVVQGLRFELPSVPGTASAARERLAVKVLKHLRAQEGKEARGA
ncbi:hypothetical protein JCM9279_005289 [Rhodotorula babjevae]